MHFGIQAFIKSHELYNNPFLDFGNEFVCCCAIVIVVYLYVFVNVFWFNVDM